MPVNVTAIETLACDAGWRNYSFVKLTTSDGIVGWSEFNEDFGSPGISAVIKLLAAKVVGQTVSDHERTYAELYAATRPAAGGVVAQAIAALENALLDAKAKALGVPVYALLGCKLRDRIPLYWSHCATWRINHPTYYKPEITSLDGVKAIGREVRQKGFAACKTKTSSSMRTASRAATGRASARHITPSSTSTRSCCGICARISRRCATAPDRMSACCSI